MALVSTQPITEMINRSISWGKGGLCAWLTTLPPSSADCLKIGSLKLLETSWLVKACNGIVFFFTHPGKVKFVNMSPLITKR
jgi:hypothetical protein